MDAESWRCGRAISIVQWKKVRCALSRSKCNRILRIGSILLVFFAFRVPFCAIAQDHSQSRATVSVSASHEIVLAAEKIRLQMLVRAESREGENAMKLLRKQQERVKKDLVVLGAVETSIEFSEATMSVGTPGVDDPDTARKMIRQQAAQMAQMRNLNPQLRGQLPNPTNEDSINDLPQIFSATAALLAEWKLENGLDEAAILLPMKLKTAIDEKDFKGRKLKEVLDPDEQLLVQPLMGSAIYSGSNRLPEFQLVYVGKISITQEEEALAEAFKKAQSHAAMLAKVAGRKLGALRSISSNANAMPQSYAQAYGPNASNPMVAFAKRNIREIGSEDPNGLRQFVVINVSFEVE